MKYTVNGGDLKKLWVWVALAATVLAMVLLDPEEPSVTAKKPETRVSLNSSAQTISHKALTVRPLPTNWPGRLLESTPIVDIFQGSRQALDLVNAGSAPTAPPVPLPQEQFVYSYFGQIINESQKTAFLLAPDQRVLAVVEGQNIDAGWKLLTLESNTMSLVHLPTGQTFQLPLGSTP